MDAKTQPRGCEKLLVVMPSWVGDAVMATPLLRALRKLYPQAHITALLKDRAKPMLEGCPWVDRIVTIRSREGKGKRKEGMLRLSRRLSSAKFDTAVLLPNSFRTALLVKLAGIPRRIGYDRDGRGVLLTDRLLPRRNKEGFVPVPTRDYYLGLASYLGATDLDPAMELFTRPDDDDKANQILASAGVRVDDPAAKLILLNPGANYGDAKMWFPERFAQVADRCVRELGADVAVSGAPKERAILDEVIGAAKERVIDLSSQGITLALLKSVIKQADLMVTNDTGPRHMAAALGTPIVTIYGPTDPAWTVIDFPWERELRVDVFCGPCQKKTCPLAGTADELICMKGVTADTVFEQAQELLALQPAKA